MSPEMYESPSSSVIAIAWTLQIDRVTAELVGALDAEKVPCILLKGPAIARWLYADGRIRPYSDTDLLVSSDRVEAAQRVLRTLGFVDRQSPMAHPRLESHDWMRDRDGQIVDLHATLIGMDAPPRVVWNTLSSTTEMIEVGGAQVDVLGIAARALHVVLHAAQHGREEAKPLEDLRRALAAVPEETWTEAAQLAVRLRATDAFATGLRLLEPGVELAGRLGLTSAGSAEASLRAEPVPLALAFEHLAATPGWRARLLIVWRELFPSVAFMRWWSPLARRGPLGLAAVYCWRPLYLLRHVGPGFLAWRRARGDAG